jgi:hypothetical protein
MDIPSEEVKRWQSIWHKVCDMAYHRRNVLTTITIVPEQGEYSKLIEYHAKYDIEPIKLDFIWKRVSQLRDENNAFLQPLVVPELREIYVPRLLFESKGVYAWFKHSFPNCVLFFWEDQM